MRTVFSLARRAGQDPAEINALERDTGAPTPSRRLVLRGGALIFGAGAAAGATARGPPAWAVIKIPQNQAHYSSRPRGANECDKCVQFQPPAACKIVDGLVSPSGSCDFFGAKAH